MHRRHIQIMVVPLARHQIDAGDITYSFLEYILPKLAIKSITHRGNGEMFPDIVNTMPYIYSAVE
jgi:hypothetical protein